MKKIIIIGGILVVFLILTLSGVFDGSKKDLVTVPVASTTTVGSLIPASPASQSNGNKSPSPTQSYKGQSISFLGEPSILNKYPKDFVDAKRKQLTDIAALIKISPKEASNWMDLGITKKIFDNYIGARDAWEYARSLSPKSALIYSNLGNLYAGYLKDNKKAETYFVEAIKLNPADPLGYLGLSEFYKNFYTEKSDQVGDVLLAGLYFSPSDPNIILGLANYYKSVKNKESAIEYFQRLLQLPNLTGAGQRQIETEIARIKSS